MAKSGKKKKSHSPKKAVPEVKPSGPSFQDKLKARWGAKAPIFLFLLGFAGLMGLFYLLFSTDFYHEYIFMPVVEANAWLGSKLLNLLGQGTRAYGEAISSPKFSIAISVGCDGLEPIALFAAALLSYPMAFRLKWPGLLAGVGFLMVLNLIRIVTLYLTGVYWRAAFDAMHLDVWQALFLILAVFTWLVWIQWATRKQASTLAPHAPLEEEADDKEASGGE